MYQRLRILCLEPPSSLNRDPTFVQVGDNDVITPNSVLYARDAMDRFHAGVHLLCRCSYDGRGEVN